LPQIEYSYAIVSNNHVIPEREPKRKVRILPANTYKTGDNNAEDFDN